ncbi:Uncharacterized protein PPKH_3643 [Pseudomonas putida]|nr:Uncharacterized protein PPKH_3643 [Pseudomonas putida]
MGLPGSPSPANRRPQVLHRSQDGVRPVGVGLPAQRFLVNKT